MPPRTSFERLLDGMDAIRDDMRELADKVATFRESTGREIAGLGKDVQALLDDRSRAADQRQRTYARVEKIEERVGDVERKVEDNTRLTATMGADIGKLKETNDDYLRQREKVAPALAQLAAIDGRVSKLERAREALAINIAWWKRLGKAGWTVVAGAAGLMLAGLVSLGVNYLGPALSMMLDALRNR